MGMDLKLLPTSHPTSFLCNDVLMFRRDDELFELIKACESKNGVDVVRGGISAPIGQTEFTPYGKRMKSLLASELLSVFELSKATCSQNAAIFAFVKNLQPYIPIYLYWH